MRNEFIVKSEKNEKSQFFVFNPLYIGALCTKTLERWWQALEWSDQNFFFIFPNIIFQKIQNLAAKIEKNQFCHFSQI